MNPNSYSKATDDLSHIFWHIRMTKDKAIRRSWQRRARLALGKRADLTDAERHEIAAVWARSDTHLYDSPAMRKLFGAKRDHRIDGEYKPAKRAMRAKFDSAGKRIRRKSNVLDFGPCANEPWPKPVQLELIEWPQQDSA